MKNVSAEDKEDGDLTSKIKVIENTVDTSKAGTYKVVYEVEDSKGAKATKEIAVKVTKSLVEISNETQLDEIIDYINNSKDKEIEIQVTSDDRVIEESIFKAIKGTEKNIKLVQDDGTVWIFEGKDITGDNLGNVTIKVSNVAEEENEKNIKQIDPNAKIIHFDYHGQLPGKATVKVKIDNPEDVKGKELTLYYYNAETKKPEKVQGPLLVDENGYVTVEITHCSDYFLSDNDLLADSNEKPVIGMNNVPVINANDVEIKVGEIFDPMKNVSAEDKEDGDLTSKIKVIENTVDTSKAGTYKVVYQVEDSKGAKSTKTISIIVKANEDTENKNEEENIEEGKTESDKQNEVPLEKLPATGQPITKMTVGIVSITVGFVLVRRRRISRYIKSKV
ncbi:MAG: immunoglobulin-like domain-containing protein, partial [Clostridium sp.]